MDKLSKQHVPWTLISDTMGDDDWCVVIAEDELNALVLVGRYEGDGDDRLCWPEYAIIERVAGSHLVVSWESQYPTTVKVSAVAFWLKAERLGLYT